jgi:hypothetical protein
MVNTGKILAPLANAFAFSTATNNLEMLTPNDTILELLRDDLRKRLDKKEHLYITFFQEAIGFKGINGFDQRGGSVHVREFTLGL